MARFVYYNPVWIFDKADKIYKKNIQNEEAFKNSNYIMAQRIRAL